MVVGVLLGTLLPLFLGLLLRARPLPPRARPLPLRAPEFVVSGTGPGGAGGPFAPLSLMIYGEVL